MSRSTRANFNGLVVWLMAHVVQNSIKHHGKWVLWLIMTCLFFVDYSVSEFFLQKEIDQE